MTRDSGDQIAALIADLFESWYSTLTRYAWRLTGNIDLAEDVVQDTFLALCRELHSGARIESPKGWTLTVVRHIVAKQMQSCGIWNRTESLEDIPADCLAQPEPDQNLEFDDVTKLFSSLTRREEEVIILRMEGMKYREIGTHLGISPKSVGTLLARALVKMQDAAKWQRRVGAKGCTAENDASETLK